MSTPAQSLSTLEENKRLTVRWFDEIWNKARREAIYEIFAETAVLHEHGADCHGPAEFTQRYDAFRERFSEFSAKPIVTLAEGDLAAIHWSADFVETSTGKHIHLTGTSIARCKDGKFLEAWQSWDQARSRGPAHRRSPAPCVIPIGASAHFCWCVVERPIECLR